MSYEEEKAAKRQLKEQERLSRTLALPVMRGELLQILDPISNGALGANIALRALEQLLVEKGILEKDVLQGRITEMAEGLTMGKPEGNDG